MRGSEKTVDNGEWTVDIGVRPMAQRWWWMSVVLAAALAGCADAPVGRPEASTASSHSPTASQAAAATIAPEPDLAAVRAGIEETLRKMSVAVGGADQAGYLACVSMIDPCWAMEQKNWAKDLGRSAPESFEVSLAGDPEVAADGSAAATVAMRWRMPGAKERSWRHAAKFVKGETGWLYAGEKWDVIEADHVRVFYEPSLEDSAKAVAEVLPGVRAHVHEGFGLENDRDLTERVQEVKLYSSMRHLQQSIYLSYSDSLSGWNEPGESIKILGNAGGKQGLRTLLGHEYGHVATFQFGPRATDMPWWILEGVAELSAQSYADDWTRTDGVVRHWAATGRLVEWERMADFHGEATQHMVNVYIQGHHMLGYISERFGREKRNAWLRAMAQGAGLDDATKDVLGEAFEKLDAEWHESLTKAEEEKK